MELSTIQSAIQPELLTLVPVLYLIGIALKNTQKISDKYIPIIIGVVSVVLSICYVLATSEITGAGAIMEAIFTAVVQGVLCAASSVYCNQLIKQLKTKDDESDSDDSDDSSANG